MTEGASRTSGGLVKRSMTFDEDVLRYLEARKAQVDRPVTYQVREILRAWMEADIAARERARLLAEGPVAGDSE